MSSRSNLAMNQTCTAKSVIALNWQKKAVAPISLSQNGNKRSLSLDLSAPDGVAVARRLIETADVMVENYRCGVMERHGLGYDAVSALNPRIIYCS
ncbi:MAG: hypothetical protein Ct9H300mP14_04270 [Gammaproteobacteria bacterium]|nr:MAG: hypothetical protein Ct9H300mP14_04270 [Gammaproteobacteria bacterium]